MQDCDCLPQGTENPLLPLFSVGAGGTQDRGYAMDSLWRADAVPAHLANWQQLFLPGCRGIQLFKILLSCSSKCFPTLPAGSHFAAQ